MKIFFDQFLADADRVPVISTEGSKIVEFFNGKTVLVTGATGFLGKLLIEKILRACPGIDRVHVIVRAKRNEDHCTRIDKLCSQSLFGPLRKLRPEFQHKINIITGDLALPELGLSLEDRQVIIEKVNVIFHMAATINFNEELTMASVINVRGTSTLLGIAEKCKFLDSFVYIGTAFSQCHEEKIEECFYATPITPKKIIDSIDDKAAMESIAKHFMGKWPNTYAFTKAVAENLVRDFEGKLPICIVRPAIVISTYNEPLKSWVDNLNGATGILLASQTGVLKSILCHSEKALEVVPADYVTNCMITAAYKTALEKNNVKISIYNYISSTENKLTNHEAGKLSLKYSGGAPSIDSCWYLCLTFSRYKAIHYSRVLLLQFLPALILDMFRVVSGKKPKMVSMCKKIAKFENVLWFFMTHQWKFENGNTQRLWDFLGKEDQKIFPFSMKELDWDDFFKTHMMGMRTYLLKEDPNNIAQARKKWNRLYVCHVVTKLTFKCLVTYMAYLVLTKIKDFFILPL